MNMAAPEPKKPPSVLERLKKLQADRQKIEDEEEEITKTAEAEILAKAETFIEELREYGLEYRFVKGRGRTADPNKDCPICNFRTDPPHDGRAHRNIEPKKPFTTAELDKMRLTKVN
jgi:hypothetical protein